jgi:hypothetical protein
MCILTSTEQEQQLALWQDHVIRRQLFESLLLE